MQDALLLLKLRAAPWRRDVIVVRPQLTPR